MKKLEINQMEEINGYGWWSGFCRGFGAFQAAYGLAIVGGLITNPPGQAVLVTAAIIDAACVFS